MKIIFDHQAFSMQAHGGVSRYFFELSRHIPRVANDHVEVIAPLHTNSYLRSSVAPKSKGLWVPKLAGTNRVRRAVSTAMSHAVLGSRHDFDIFHQTYYSAANYAPHGAKRVVTVFDMIHEKFPKYFSRLDATAEKKVIAVRRADHVICISENTRQDLIEITGIAVEKTSVVHLGCSLTRIEPLADQPEAPTRPYILFVGERRGYKNFEALLHAYAESALLRRSFSLTCFGGAPLTEREKSLMQKLKMAPGDLTWISGDDAVLSSMYSNASVFVYPSLYEGFGIPLLEAMALGCPVACSNSSSLPEVAGDAAELFDPRDQSAIQKAIERVVSSPGRSCDLVARGYQRIEHFSWDRCARESLAVYRNVLGMQ